MPFRLAVTVSLLAACAGGARPNASLADRPRVPAEQPIAAAVEPITVIVSSELGAAGSSASLYDALLRLRPRLVQWSYRSGARVEEQTPTVFVDGMRVGDVNALYRIPSGSVRKVLVLGPETARVRYGPDVMGGAILVTLIH